MADDQKDFQEWLQKLAAFTGFGAVFGLLMHLVGGRRFLGEIGRLVGLVLTNVHHEGDAALDTVKKLSIAEANRLLTNSVAAATAIAILGILCMALASMIPNALVEGLVISALLAGIILLFHGILIIILPVWAIVTALATGASKASELKLSADGVKEAPSWFFGTLTAMGGAVTEKVSATYRWFTRATSWISIAAAYLWAVAFHQAPELIAGFALPLIFVFYGFNQGWRAEEEHRERSGLWRAVEYSAALVLLDMAFLASFPSIYKPLMAPASDSNILIRGVAWVVLLAQIVMVVKWARGSKASGSVGGSGRSLRGSADAIVSLGLLLVFVAFIAFMIFRHELDVRHSPAKIVQKELGLKDAWLPGFNTNPREFLSGKFFTTQPPVVEGDGRFADTPAQMNRLGGSGDSFLVTVDVTRPGWQLIARTLARGETVHYRVLDAFYKADSAGVVIQVPVDGFRVNGIPFQPGDKAGLEDHCLTSDATFGALIMRVGQRRPQAMVVPDGQLDLTDRGVPLGPPQQLAVAVNLMQEPSQFGFVSGRIRIIFWIERPVQS